MKKLNEKNPNDNEQMKLYKKENRKMLYRLEDALAENDQLQKKLIKISTVVDKIVHIIVDKKIKSGSIIRIEGEENE